VDLYSTNLWIPTPEVSEKSCQSTHGFKSVFLQKQIVAQRKFRFKSVVLGTPIQMRPGDYISREKSAGDMNRDSMESNHKDFLVIMKTCTSLYTDIFGKLTKHDAEGFPEEFAPGLPFEPLRRVRKMGKQESSYHIYIHQYKI
jgi:hypothetical protein